MNDEPGRVYPPEPSPDRREPMHPDAPNPIIRGILAMMMGAGVLGIAVALIFHDVPRDNADVLGALLGQLVTIFAGVTAFYFIQRSKEKK